MDRTVANGESGDCLHVKRASTEASESTFRTASGASHHASVVLNMRLVSAIDGPQ